MKGEHTAHFGLKCGVKIEIYWKQQYRITFKTLNTIAVEKENDNMEAMYY